MYKDAEVRGDVFMAGGCLKVKDTEVLGGAVLCCW